MLYEVITYRSPAFRVHTRLSGEGSVKDIGGVREDNAGDSHYREYALDFPDVSRFHKSGDDVEFPVSYNFV